MDQKKKQLIIFVTFFLAVCGLFVELLPLARQTSIDLGSKVIYELQVLQSINLSFFGSRLFEFFNFDTNATTNFLNVIFYTLLLTGGVLFITSKQRETRLLSFSFSILFLMNTLWFLDRNLVLIYLFIKHPSFSIPWIQTLMFQFKCLIFIYLSFKIVKWLISERSIDRTQIADEDAANYASKAQRFFHLAFDTILCLLIFSLFARAYGGDTLRNLEKIAGERGTLWLLLILFRLIYYPFFETIFQATPAKFLTETIVIDGGNLKMNFKKAMGRTLSRFVPFEPFSFFGYQGWHDQWTNTHVVRLVPTGVKGGKYFLLLPLFVVIGLTGYFGYEKYEGYQQYVYSKNEHNKRIARIERELKNISSYNFIKLVDPKDSYSSNAIYLKIEEVEQDELFVTVIPFKSYSNLAIFEVSKFYSEKNNVLGKALVKKSDLMRAFTKDYDQYRSGKTKSADILKDGKLYEVNEVFVQYKPKIEGNKGGSIHGPDISLTFENCGWTGGVTEIQNIEGEIKWSDQLPLTIPGCEDQKYNCRSFSLQGTNYQRGDKYKFKFTVIDQVKHKRSFLVEGSDLRCTFSEAEQ